MAGSPVIVFAGLALFLAISQPAAADLDIYFYDDGASGMAISMVGSIASSLHTLYSGTACNGSPIFVAYAGFCWNNPIPVNVYYLDRSTDDVYPQFTYDLDVNPSLPDAGLTGNYLFFNPAFDGVEISAVDHLPGFDVATVRNMRLSDFHPLRHSQIRFPLQENAIWPAWYRDVPVVELSPSNTN